MLFRLKGDVLCACLCFLQEHLIEHNGHFWAHLSSYQKENIEKLPSCPWAACICSNEAANDSTPLKYVLSNAVKYSHECRNCEAESIGIMQLSTKIKPWAIKTLSQRENYVTYSMSFPANCVAFWHIFGDSAKAGRRLPHIEVFQKRQMVETLNNNKL